MSRSGWHVGDWFTFAELTSFLHGPVVVQVRFPEVDAVSVGAILSNYQRVRVEHVYVI